MRRYILIIAMFIAGAIPSTAFATNWTFNHNNALGVGGDIGHVVVVEGPIRRKGSARNRTGDEHRYD